MDYEAGVVFALIIWIWSIISLVIRLNSQFERNLRKLGFKTSWLWRTPTPMVDTDLHASFFKRFCKWILVFGFALPFVLLSWVQVGLWFAMVAYGFFNDYGAPPAVREYRWRLKNLDMSLEEIVRASMKAREIDPTDFDMVYSDTLNEMRERGLA